LIDRSDASVFRRLSRTLADAYVAELSAFVRLPRESRRSDTRRRQAAVATASQRARAPWKESHSRRDGLAMAVSRRPRFATVALASLAIAVLLRSRLNREVERPVASQTHQALPC